MPRLAVPGLVLFGYLLVSRAAYADHLAIDLKAEAEKASKEVKGEVLDIGVTPQPRGVLEVKAGSRITVRWTLRHTDAKSTLKNVLVHFFVVKEDQPGQKDVPKLTRDVVVESALTMDFQPRDESQGELHFVIGKTGCYLLRLETQGAAVGAEGHEHFAALDLLVR